MLRRQPDLDIRRKQDSVIGRADDRQVLAWAASEGRVLLTHDGEIRLRTSSRRTPDARRI